MEESFNHIDQLFKEKLQNYEVTPPEHIWSNIQRKVQNPGKGGGSKGYIPGGGIMALIVVLIVSGVFLYYQSSQEIEASISSQNKIELAANDESNYVNTIDHFTSQSNRASTTIKNSSKGIKNYPIEINSNNEYSLTSVNPEIITDSNTNVTQNVTKVVFPENSSISSLRNKTIDKLGGQYGPFDPSISINERFSGDINESNIEVNRYTLFNNSKWIFGLHINPEIVLNNPDRDVYKRSLGLDVSARMQFSSYFAESGLGFSISEDDGKATVDFERYEFLGSYEDVYDVTFDSTENGVIPVYHTQTVDVYDSIRHISITETKNLYTYFNFPLFFGYTIDAHKLGFTFKTGPVLSILAGKNENIKYPYQDIRVINQSQDIPSRINTYLTMIISAGVNYRISRSLKFSVEPGFRYYLNSIYKDNQKNFSKPYSFGIRTGLLFNID